MKTFFTTNKLMYWLVIFLVVLNVTAVVLILYNNYRVRDSKSPICIPHHSVKHHPGIFMKDALKLTDMQSEKFLSARQSFQQKAWKIKKELNANKNEFIKELGHEAPDTNKIDEICDEIGNLHAQLKLETSHYYLTLKEICTPAQQKALNSFFMNTIGHEEGEMIQHHPRQIHHNHQKSKIKE